MTFQEDLGLMRGLGALFLKVGKKMARSILRRPFYQIKAGAV